MHTQAIELLVERLALEGEKPGAEAGCTGAQPDAGALPSPSSSDAALLEGRPQSPDSSSVARPSSEGQAVVAEKGGLPGAESSAVAKPIGRKQKCTCGSGRKYKDCCRKKDRCPDQPTSAQKIIMAEHILMSAAICV